MLTVMLGRKNSTPCTDGGEARGEMKEGKHKNACIFPLRPSLTCVIEENSSGAAVPVCTAVLAETTVGIERPRVGFVGGKVEGDTTP